MRRTRAMIIGTALAGLSSAGAGAQRPAKAACKVDSTAEWFVKQRAWLDDTRAVSGEAMRAMLVSATGMTSSPLAVQMGYELDGAAMAAMNDSAAIAQLRALAATRGSTWPVKSVAGAQGVRAVWLLAHRDTALARAALKRMMEAGPDESHAADVATLEDRVRLQSGRKQLYGTQFRRGADGRIVLAPMEDSAHVDLRREDAGLPPFRTSACLVRAVR